MRLNCPSSTQKVDIEVVSIDTVMMQLVRYEEKEGEVAEVSLVL